MNRTSAGCLRRVEPTTLGRMPWFDRLGREPASQQLPGSPGRATISDRADPPTKPEAAPAEHPATGRRLPALDVLRGIAILGTLASNIWIFTSVIGLSAGARPTESGTSLLADVSSWLPNGKFLGLLTIMFGIGLEIQRQAAVRAGKKVVADRDVPHRAHRHDGVVGGSNR